MDYLKNLIQKKETFLPDKDEHPRIHSLKLDEKLGFKIVEVETKLLDQKVSQSQEKSNTWLGLHPQILQTPYSEIYEFLDYLKPFNVKSFIDLGAGYGRMAVVMQATHPEASFAGFELVNERVVEAKRVFDLLELGNCDIHKANILDEDFKLASADVYFIYDFSDPHDLRLLLPKLSDRISSEKFFMVARGKGVRSLIQLRYPEFWAAYGVYHTDNWSLYSSFTEVLHKRDD